jgi:integrase
MIALVDVALRRLTACQRPWDGGDGRPRQPFRAEPPPPDLLGQGEEDIDRAALSKLFSWPVEHRKIIINPAIGRYKPKAPPAGDRVLSEAEIKWVWQACDTLGEPFASLLKLLTLTGCRRGEVAGMMPGELREDGAIWTIPGARTKNGRQHVVYLPPLAREIIAAVPRVDGKAGYLFTTTGKSPVSGWSEIKRRLDTAMLALAGADRGADAAVREWRLPGLRRTCATTWPSWGSRRTSSKLR